MAKKTSRKKRRQRKPNVPKYTGPVAQAVEEDAPAVTKPAGLPMTGSAVVDRAVDFTAEYRYVIADLRNMGIVAALMLILLLVLNFIV